MKKTLFMETTKIEPSKTVFEIQRALGEYGATAILTEYEGREVSALSFKIFANGQQIPFILPCRWNPVLEVLNSRRKNKRVTKRPDDVLQAKRVAWRQILRWVQAQMALVNTNMVKMEEVFLPYMQSKNGKTIYEALESSKFKLLENKS